MYALATTTAATIMPPAFPLLTPPEAIYLEGIYVAPEERGQGAGVRFVSQLTRTLLSGTKSICMLVNETNEAAQACYQKAGYKVRGYYDTVFLQ